MEMDEIFCKVGFNLLKITVKTTRKLKFFVTNKTSSVIVCKNGA